MIVYEPARAATRIDTVDLTGSFDDAAEQARVAREIHQALRETGFFTVTGHGVPLSLSDAMIAQTRALFALDDAAKQALSIHHSRARRGYEATGQQVLDAGSAADFKESFMLARDLPESHPWVRAGLPMQGPNQWPDLPDFKAQIEQYQARWCALAVT